MDRQLLEIAVAAAKLSTAPFVCRSVDVVVLVAIANSHVVLLLHMLESIVARAELDVAIRTSTLCAHLSPFESLCRC